MDHGNAPDSIRVHSSIRVNSSIRVLLLKTPSTPDRYAEAFSQSDRLESSFVPVLEHAFDSRGLQLLRQNLQSLSPSPTSCGGLVFTSQRAVEALALVRQEDAASIDWPHLSRLPIYVVGPATQRALAAIPDLGRLQLFGAHTGSGDALAAFILEHYNAWHARAPVKPPLLFPVGHQRRDIIPTTLQADSLPGPQRIAVTEVPVYRSVQVPTLSADLERELRDGRLTWLVLFSPTACEAVLRALGRLDEGGRARSRDRLGRTLIVTIGPTTRDHLINRYGVRPDACAQTPTPEGVRQATEAFMAEATAAETTAEATAAE
jgi:uroporphyrinogen-III synthase